MTIIATHNDPSHDATDQDRQGLGSLSAPALPAPSMCDLSRIEADIALMDLAALGGEEFIASIKRGNGIGDRSEHNTKHNPWGWQ